MIDYFFIAVISSIVIYVDKRMSGWNDNVSGNGVGSVSFVNTGTATLPVQHRVLAPWLTRYLDYYHIKWLSITAALFCSWLYFGLVMAQPMVGVLLLAIYFMWAAVFDYTDGYIEIAMFALSFWMVGALPITLFLIPVGILAGLNRETSVFIPLCLFSMGHVVGSSMVGLGVLIGLAVPRIIYRDAKRYCSVNQFFTNVRRMFSGGLGGKHFLHSEWVLFFILTTVLVLCYIAGPLSVTHYVLAALYLLLLIPTVWGEIRVFAPVFWFVIPIIGRFV